MSKQVSTDGLDVYLVGGAVRDALLGRQVVERDFLVVGSHVEQMLARGFKQVGKDFPVFLHPETKEEYALARTERKKGTGYTGFVCHASPDVTIEQDLFRRDLTVNAMAQSIDGEIVDPYNGMVDLKDKVLRHVSEAFVEDPLRVLRVARFAARYHYLNFTVAPETMALMKKIAESGELNALSAERIWKEFEGGLNESSPDIFILVLKECGALKQLWPELDELWGIPNPPKWHPEICTGEHTMMVLRRASELSDKLSIRFAALCHDLGKSLTPPEQWPSHRGHEKSGLPLVKAICERIRVPNHIKLLCLQVCEFHLHVHKARELKATTILKLFDQLNAWNKPDDFHDFLLVCQADFQGRKDLESSPYLQKDYLTELYNGASQIIAKPFVEQGLKGIEIKHAISNARLDAIKVHKSQFKWPD